MIPNSRARAALAPASVPRCMRSIVAVIFASRQDTRDHVDQAPPGPIPSPPITHAAVRGRVTVSSQPVWQVRGLPRWRRPDLSQASTTLLLLLVALLSLYPIA